MTVDTSLFQDPMFPQPPLDNSPIGEWARSFVNSLREHQFGVVDGTRQQITQLESDYIAADASLEAGITIELGTLTTDVAAVASRVTTLESQVQTPTTGLLARVTITESTIATHDTAIATLNTTVGTHGTSITQLITDVDTVEARVTTTEADIITNATAISTLDGSVATLSTTVSSHTSSITTINSTLTTRARVWLQTSAPSSGHQTGDLWLDSDDGYKVYRYSGMAWDPVPDARIATNEANITTNATAITTLDGAVATLNTTVSAHTTSITTAESEIDTLQADLNTAEATIVTNTASIGTNASAITTLNSSLSTLTTTVSANTTSITTINSTKNQTFRATSAPTAGATGDLWIDSDDNEKLYRWSGSAWVAVPDGRIDTLVTDLDTAETTIVTNTANISTNASAITTLTTSVSSLSTTVSSHTSSITTLGTDLDTAEAGLATAGGNITTLQGQMTTANANISTLSTTTTDLTSALATTNSTVAANYSVTTATGSINSSPNFADNANATGLPTNWTNWSYGYLATRVTGIAPQPYAVQLDGTAGDNVGIVQSLLGRISTGWHVLEADVTLNSGAFGAAGLYTDWDSGGAAINFASDLDTNGGAPGAGTTGRLYKFRKLVQVTAGTTYQNLYCMSHWNGFGSVASANSITWHRAAIRPASQAEIEARQATTDLVTANATISSHTSSIASNTSAISALTTSVAASFASAAQAGANLLANSTGAKGLLNWTNPGAWGAYPHPLWGPWFYRGFTGATVTEQFYSDEFEAIAGEAYSFSFIPYISGLTSGVIRLAVGWYNSSHSYIGETPSVTLTSGMHRVRQVLENSAAPTGTAYGRLVVTFTSAVGNGTYAEFGFWQAKVEGGAKATTWRDDAVLNEAVSRLTTAEAAIVTNSSAIATETSARAAADTTLTASFSAAIAPSTNLVKYPSGTARNDPYGEGLSTAAQGWTVSGGATGSGFGNGYWDPAGGAIFYENWASGYSSGTDRVYLLDIPISIGGAPYTFSFNGYVSNLDPATCGIYLDAYNGSTYLNSSSFVTFASQGGNSIGPRRSVTFTPGSGATKIQIIVRIPAQTSPTATYANLVMRAFQLEYGSTATKFNEAGRIIAGETRIGTAEAGIATNSSAIATESSARAAADTTLTASVTALVPNTNLITNPTWSKSTDGWGFYNCSSGFGADVGAYCSGNLSGSGYIQAAAPRITGLTAGQTLTVSVNAGGSWTGATVGFGLWCYDASDNYLGNVATVNAASGAGYQRLSATGTLPTGCTSVTFWFYCGAINGWALFFKPKVEIGSIATVFTDDRTVAAINAVVATNTSAIATETSARAAADSSLSASLGTTNASVSTNSSAIATINGAAAFWETIVAAGGGDLAAVRLKAGASGSYLELISTVLRLANVSNGAIIEVMRAVGGEAYFSRPISSDGGGERLTVGPGYGSSGSEVVLWFGPDSIAPSSQSRTNGYFALGTDGEIYYGSAVLDAGVDAATKTGTANFDNVTTSGTTLATMATIDLTVGLGGYLELLSPLFYGPLSISAETGLTLSSGTDWYGDLTITEQLQSGGTETTLWTIPIQVSDTGGGFFDFIFAPPINKVVAQNVSGASRYRIKIQRTSGSNNISGNGIQGVFTIRRTP
ncbi:MAG: hypothetical protein B7Z37_03090 [Verrucomicrobia bacterium 12-59-8]|nr:MAG: hypothetical protein B7Z37_03090 [Verrucomicrobia bacterium 12-59-8]